MQLELFQTPDRRSRTVPEPVPILNTETSPETDHRTSPECDHRESPKLVLNVTTSSRLLVASACPRRAAVKATVQAATGSQILILPQIAGGETKIALNDTSSVQAEIVAFPSGNELDAYRVARFLKAHLADGPKLASQASIAARRATGADKAAYQQARAVARLWGIGMQRGFYLSLNGDQHRVPLGAEDYTNPPFRKQYGAVSPKWKPDAKQTTKRPPYPCRGPGDDPRAA